MSKMGGTSCVVAGRKDRRIFTVLRKGIIFQNKELYRK
ncbi:hypothetical protein TDIS_1846 [Thermosulfurimonas dismutans]|uniref:Uncharacterized protein n=1 Tax=Thermosulfurimonas dismutans TaxID=999894 RepID=A0A179D1T8_9BACT|nr:hypothetical protein TDIS_1846 [Thermosulfurimonas dismutans]